MLYSGWRSVHRRYLTVVASVLKALGAYLDTVRPHRQSHYRLGHLPHRLAQQAAHNAHLLKPRR